MSDDKTFGAPLPPMGPVPEEQSEIHKNFNQTVDEIHSLIGKRLDELQKAIDQVRMLIGDNTVKVKDQVGKHLIAAESALVLTDKVHVEIEQIKTSLNG